MKLWIPIVIAAAVGVWLVPLLWRDFRAGRIFPGPMAVTRADHPFVYWMLLSLQVSLILLALITIAVAVPVALRDLAS